MSRAPKFQPGSAVRSLTAIVALIEEGQWFYWPNDTLMSPKFLANMSLSTLAAVSRGHQGLRLAIPNDERIP